MQLTPAQRRYFIDPVQDPTTTTTHLLVTEERTQRGRNLDKVVAVRKERYQYEHRYWWITEDGDHVAGAPVNPPNMPSWRRAIGVGGDDWFWLATPSRFLGRDVGYTCSSLARSDGRQFPNTNGSYSMDIKQVVLAAPWAGELFPAATDSDAVVRAKLDLAEQRWNHRKAKAEIIRQGMGRGWNDDLHELRENGKLPAATFGAYYKGRVMIEATTVPELSARDTTRLEEFRSHAAVASQVTARPSALIGLEVAVPLQVTIDINDSVRKLGHAELVDALRVATGDHTAVPGDHTLSPVLRSVAS